MDIIVAGEERDMQECRRKFGEGHDYVLVKIHSDVAKVLKSDSVVFDFLISEKDNQATVYQGFSGAVFLNTSRNTLEQLTQGLTGNFFGFCGLPSFLAREVFEISIAKHSNEKVLERTCEALKTKFVLVKDQIGLVTARVICMVINEAYFAIEENIASRTDIDLAMKLGTNYPFGPFEWSEKIGVKNVYELLDAVYNETRDERYKICNLLKTEALH